MKQHSIGLQAAIDLIGSMCQEATDRFINDRTKLPSWGPDIDTQVETYVDGLQDWIVGTLMWSFLTERYFAKSGREVLQTRVIELLPRRKQ